MRLVQLLRPLVPMFNIRHTKAMEWQLDLADATTTEAWDSVKQAIVGTRTHRGPAAARAVNDHGSHIHLTWKASVSYGSV